MCSVDLAVARSPCSLLSVPLWFIEMYECETPSGGGAQAGHTGECGVRLSGCGRRASAVSVDEFAPNRWSAALSSTSAAAHRRPATAVSAYCKALVTCCRKPAIVPFCLKCADTRSARNRARQHDPRTTADPARARLPRAAWWTRCSDVPAQVGLHQHGAVDGSRTRNT